MLFPSIEDRSAVKNVGCSSLRYSAIGTSSPDGCWHRDDGRLPTVEEMGRHSVNCRKLCGPEAVLLGRRNRKRQSIVARGEIPHGSTLSVTGKDTAAD